MSMVLGDDSDASLDEWRDLESSLTDERLQAFKDFKDELNKATVSSSTGRSGGVSGYPRAWYRSVL